MTAFTERGRGLWTQCTKTLSICKERRGQVISWSTRKASDMPPKKTPNKNKNKNELLSRHTESRWCDVPDPFWLVNSSPKELKYNFLTLFYLAQMQLLRAAQSQWLNVPSHKTEVNSCKFTRSFRVLWFIPTGKLQAGSGFIKYEMAAVSFSISSTYFAVNKRNQ